MSSKHLLIIAGLIFLSGCRVAEPVSQKIEQIEKPEYTVELQFAAPWNLELYEEAYKKAEAIQPAMLEPIKGGIVPHHLASAHTVAAFFETIKKQQASTIVLIGPNHFDQGPYLITTTKRDWKTPFGNLKTNHDLVDQLLEADIVGINEAVLEEEHSLYSHMSFIKRSVGETTVLPLALKEVERREHLDDLIEALIDILPEDAVIVGSIDFSHFQPLPVAHFHDELSKNVVRNSDITRHSSIEIDSTASLYTFLQLMEHYGTQRVVHEHHTNSVELAGAPEDYNSTSHYIPYFAKGEPDSERAVSILQFGDMMLDRGVARRMREHGGADYIFEALAGEEDRFFEGIDIVTANLEGSFANYRRETSKEIAFRFDPALIPTLQKYHFNLFTLANNHSLDMGRAAFQETKDNLDAAGIAYYGNQFTVQDDSLLVQETAGKKIAWLGLNDTHNSMNEEKVEALLAKAEAEADITIVNIHWGIEYEPLSHPRQQFLAHSFIDQGADIIIGHHPHVVQEIEIYKDAPIFYSLGNFVFDQYFSVPTQQSLAVGMTLYDDTISLYVFPIEGRDSQVHYMPYRRGQLFMQDVFDRSKLETYTFDNNFHLELPLNP